MTSPLRPSHRKRCYGHLPAVGALTRARGGTFAIVVAAFALALASPLSANAMPMQSDLGPDGAIQLVAGGCGPGMHRGPMGGCQMNRGWRRPVERCVVRVHRTPYGLRRVRVCHR